MIKFSLALFLFFGCGASKTSNFHVNQFSGVDLEGKLVELGKVSTPNLVLNVYSPTCVPCYKEIPTLNYLYKELEKTKLGKLYIAVDPFIVLEDPESLTIESREKKTIELMQEEVKKRNIQVPVLVMKPEFRVTPQGGLITGTPETLIFHTDPLRLYYNFIGSICEKTNLEDIQNDSKVKFFKKLLGGI